jgi:hypothetical protein
MTSEEELYTLSAFERKIIRKMYDPVHEEDSWRIRTNKGYRMY